MRDLRPAAARIAADPEYGVLVCHCERVSRGDIRDALAGPIPPRTPEGLRRRTRARAGRCQGTHCGPEVRALLAETTAVAAPPGKAGPV
ncbi:(2Fe-2S)-binding protein [Streptomyces sp. Tue 6430]|nr:(2Fe-2S)-binding protein [Streptomyces sp. Tue 6430]